jgi:hypothetical protein
MKSPPPKGVGTVCFTSLFLSFFDIAILFFICYNDLRVSVKNPGVAQLGSALEWGSRGRGFNSRHSDQATRLTNGFFKPFVSLLHLINIAILSWFSIIIYDYEGTNRGQN